MYRAGSSQKSLAGLARLGSKKSQNPSYARLGLEQVLNFWAELSLGSEKWRFTTQARLELGESDNFYLDPIIPIGIKLDLMVKLLPKLIQFYIVFSTLTLWQSIGSLQSSSQMELKSPSWPGSARFGEKYKIPARLAFGSKANEISELSSARAQNKVWFPI